MSSTEDSNTLVISEFNAGISFSIRAALKAYNTPDATLHGQIQGATTPFIKC